MPNSLYADLQLTNFPDETDSFLTYVNIASDDGPKVKQYIEAMNSGNQTLANQILQTIPAASQKIIKATDLNKLTQAILSVERFYKTDVQPFIEQKQQEWINIINQFNYKGKWSSVVNYLVNNMVTYTVSDVDLIYIATSSPPVGTTPTNTNYWRVLTIQGVQGQPGRGLTYRGLWKGNVQYRENEAVTHEGALWFSLASNNGVAPGTNATYWEKGISLITAYPVQDNEPSDMAVGGLWFNTSGNPTNYYHLTNLNNPATAEYILEGFQAYNDKGDVVIGTMKNLNMTNLEIKNPPDKIEYVIGETFDPTGMVVTVVFNGEYKIDVRDFTFSPNTPLTVNDTTITINYSNFGTTVNTTFNITIT